MINALFVDANQEIRARSPVVESWKVHLEPASDCARITDNPEVTGLGKSCRQYANGYAGQACLFDFF